MNENENLEPVQKLTPFTKMVMSIGTLPSSFYASMSYYESMVWLYEYLKNEVIPTVNGNAEAVEELQEKFIELKTWIDEYFDNLDLQEEVNKKLDEMAEDGTLTNLIKSYVDPIYEAYESEINGQWTDYKNNLNGEWSSYQTNVTNRLDAQDIQIQAVESGSPLVASSTSEMTETDRVYVNTTDGYWYYYDGDSWEQGGVYESSESIDNLKALTTQALGINYTELDNDNTLIQSSNLQDSTNPHYKTSNLITIEAGQTLYAYAYTDNDSVAVVVECDSEGTRETCLLKGVQAGFATKTISFNKKSYVEVCAKYAQGFKFMIYNSNTEINNELNNLNQNIEKSTNLTNIATYSETGYWCNYATGVFEDSTTRPQIANYKCSDYIEVEPNTNYACGYQQHGIVFFDTGKKYISGTTNKTFTTPTSTRYLVIDVDTTDPTWDKVMLLKNHAEITQNDLFIPYYFDFKYKKDESNYIRIGATRDFKTIKDGFQYAIDNDKGVIIDPGTYNLVSEGITGTGYKAPKEIIGYGAILICNLNSEDWNLSPINIPTTQKETIIKGLTIICSNCRYCIHDDFGNQTISYYHNVYKDLTLIHNSNASATLLAPQCIGGGFGNHGRVDIENCNFTSQIDRDVSYHSKSPAPQTGNCELYCSNSIFTSTFTCGPIGTSTDYLNTAYVSNSLFGTSIPSNQESYNAKVVSWNNSLSS